MMMVLTRKYRIFRNKADDDAAAGVFGGPRARPKAKRAGAQTDGHEHGPLNQQRCGSSTSTPLNPSSLARIPPVKNMRAPRAYRAYDCRDCAPTVQ
jgi:hypothetical protein